MRLEQERGAQHHDKNVEAVTEHDDIYDDDNARNHHGHGGIELLPIVTRGCLCELAKTIGFDPQQIEKSYSFSNQMIQTFRRESETSCRYLLLMFNIKLISFSDIRRSSADAGSNSKFVRNLHLAKLKFPFPHMVSVLLQQNSGTKSNHLISQGTADIILGNYLLHNVFGNFSYFKKL